MEYKLITSLMDKIQEWVDVQCEEDSWPNVVYGTRTTEYMAIAAIQVLMACLESQEYGKKEGLFEE